LGNAPHKKYLWHEASQPGMESHLRPNHPKLGLQTCSLQMVRLPSHNRNWDDFFAVHVDDIIFVTSTSDKNNRFKADLDTKWKFSDIGEAKFALGIAISCNRNERTISLSQTALIDRIVSEFGQTDAHSVDTPMVAGLHL
jgi:hypothetical protein